MADAIPSPTIESTVDPDANDTTNMEDEFDPLTCPLEKGDFVRISDMYVTLQKRRWIVFVFILSLTYRIVQWLSIFETLA
jgi:hypothetical protein